MIPIKAHMKSGGEFRLITRNPDGSMGDDTGWFPNLVTDGGLINMTTVSAWANRFHIGDSNNAPAFSDSALFGWLAQSATGSDLQTNLGMDDYQGQMTRTRRFDPGASRIIREIGVNNDADNEAMSIRALVTPEISQSDVQKLDALYRFTTWPNLNDGTGIVNIFGDDYDYIVRMGTVDQFERPFGQYQPQLVGGVAFNGDIGSVTGEPAGDSESDTLITITSQGSGFCNFDIFFDVDAGNLTDPDGIRSIRCLLFDSTGLSQLLIQVQFNNRGEGTGVLDSRIPKDGTREITFNLGMTWGRHVP